MRLYNEKKKVNITVKKKKKKKKKKKVLYTQMQELIAENDT